MVLRIDIRPDVKAKARLDRAATRLGLPLSSFVLSAALERAEEILSREERVLSDRDRDRIMALLEGVSSAPNKALRKAGKLRAQLLGRTQE